jgi:interferon-induced GTP-binding protein Mx1
LSYPIAYEAGKTSATVKIRWDSDPTYADDGFNPIECKSFDEIPAAITAAQQCIVKQSNRQVAPDIVEVNVVDKDCVDLTLIDLPGLVRTTGKDEDSSIIQQIDDILHTYLNNPRCILLAIIPANVDFHNSQMMTEVRKVDPTTERTIPVITKPDLIDPGAEQGVLDLLLGKKTNEFTLDFHMVKFRGQKALDDGLYKGLMKNPFSSLRNLHGVLPINNPSNCLVWKS